MAVLVAMVDRDAPRPRRARLALLRDGVPLAARDLGDPGGQRDDPARGWRRRWRGGTGSAHRSPASSAGLSLALKPILWPLLFWLAATRRMRAAVWTLGVQPSRSSSRGARSVSRPPRVPASPPSPAGSRGAEGYTVYALATDLGAAPGRRAGARSRACRVGCSRAVVVLGRRGDDRRAFILALAAALACSPIVWLPLLRLAPRRRRGRPSRGSGRRGSCRSRCTARRGRTTGTTRRTALTIASAAVTVLLALRIAPAVYAPALLRGRTVYCSSAGG